MRRCHYQTKQKKILFDVIKNYNSEFSVKEIYEKTKVGLTTIYRFIEQLGSDGVIKKLLIDGEVYYQYLGECHLDNHFYLKCNSCGKTIHVDCDCINDLVSHVFDNHKFLINKSNIMIPGLCVECGGKL